jgi:hypothetical protein
VRKGAGIVVLPDAWAGAKSRSLRYGAKAPPVEMTVLWWKGRVQQIPYGDDRKNGNSNDNTNCSCSCNNNGDDNDNISNYAASISASSSSTVSSRFFIRK